MRTKLQTTRCHGMKNYKTVVGIYLFNKFIQVKTSCRYICTSKPFNNNC